MAVKEIQYKLNTDLDSNILISLRDFLKQKDVQNRGITQHNVHQYLAVASLTLVYNPQSSSSKVHLCVDPSRQNSAHKSVNDIFYSGCSHLPDIAENIITS